MPITSNLRSVGAVLLGLGAAGLAATCVFYVLAGPVAALPGGAPDVIAAIAATPRAAGWMRAAGNTGMPSDVLLAVGALLLSADDLARGRGVALAGWLALAMASALFVVVDAMVAFVLPVAAAQLDGVAAYAGVRALFDVLFTIGAWMASGGALATTWPRDGWLFRSAVAGWGMRAAGAVGLAASTATLAGLPGAALIGPSIAVLSVAVGACAALAWADRASPAGA